jgi:hypothetical protein
MKLPTMDNPAIYRIQVRGRLDAAWSERFGGLNITEIRTGDGEIETVLVGRLTDQADLSGVLEALYESHLPVLSAECLGGDPEDAGTPRTSI